MARGVPHTDETKSAVMAALLAGQSISQVAAQYRLPEGTVAEWRRQVHGVQALKKQELSDLVGDCLREFITSVQVYARETRDPEYIKKQPASEIAVLLGVVADKAFRILEAAEVAGEREAEQSLGAVAGAADAGLPERGR